MEANASSYDILFPLHLGWTYLTWLEQNLCVCVMHLTMSGCLWGEHDEARTRTPRPETRWPCGDTSEDRWALRGQRAVFCREHSDSWVSLELGWVWERGHSTPRGPTCSLHHSSHRIPVCRWSGTARWPQGLVSFADPHGQDLTWPHPNSEPPDPSAALVEPWSSIELLGGLFLTPCLQEEFLVFGIFYLCHI